jgi:hypothetical protein
MASQFTDTQLTKWAQTYEGQLCATHDLLIDRLSLDITANVNEYELPNYVTNVTAVLWQGKELHAKGFRASVITGDTPFQTSGSIPFEYVFSGKGMRVLKFYPSPNTAVAYDPGNLWNPTADTNDVIVEFYRTPNYLAYPPMQLPAWCRQYLLKDHVCWKAFAVEGPQQDLKAAQYYDDRIKKGIQYIGLIKENMHKSQMNVLYDNKFLARRKPGRPVLPPTFGYPVNW